MKNLLSFACAALISSTSALKLRSQFPQFPINGTEVATAIGNVLATGGKRELGKAMYERHCESEHNPNIIPGSAADRCWDSGLRSGLQNIQMHLKMQDNISFYDPKYLTDLIEAEYAQFVAGLQAHTQQLGGMIDGALNATSNTLTAAGFAQLESDEQEGEGRILAQQGPPGPPGPPGPMGPLGAPGSIQKFHGSTVAGLLNQMIPPAPVISQMIKDHLKKTAAEVQDPKNTQEILKFLTAQIASTNEMLEREGKRLGLGPLVDKPDPLSTAQKILDGLREKAPLINDANLAMVDGYVGMAKSSILSTAAAAEGATRGFLGNDAASRIDATMVSLLNPPVLTARLGDLGRATGINIDPNEASGFIKGVAEAAKKATSNDIWK